nr:MAG TPA: cysteine-rich protein [Caudoviricetes sp.]
MRTQRESGKLVVVNGWVTCPICRRNRRLLRVSPDTRADYLPVYCRDCKQEIILHIERGQSVERRSP